MKLNLGCGNNYLEGWLNADHNDNNFKKDIVINFNDKLPFQDKSFDYVLMSESLNYVDADKTINVMIELHRVLEDDGLLEIRLPHFSYLGAYGFKHRIFSLQSFRIFTDVNNQEYIPNLPKELYKYPMFEIIEQKLYYQRTKDIQLKKGFYYYFSKVISCLGNLNPKFCERVWCHWFGGFQEFIIILKKVPITIEK